ncbi:MAG: ThiF family adenylyltransferase, partial [Thermoplasmata archaeon]
MEFTEVMEAVAAIDNKQSEPTLPFKEPMKVDYWRQLDFYNPANDNSEVLIIGAGSIGSYTAFCLQRMGVKNITVVDFDSVEPHNLPNQFFIPPMETTLKVKALYETLAVLNPTADRIRIQPVEWEIFRQTNNLSAYNTVFMCVDDMNVRKSIYVAFKQVGSNIFLCDARVGGLFGHVFSVCMTDSFDREYFEAKLWANEDAAPLPCTATITNYVAMGISAEL